MKKYKSYYTMHQFDMQKFENIEDKKVIHQFESKQLTIDLGELKDKYILNQIR